MNGLITILLFLAVAGYGALIPHVNNYPRYAYKYAVRDPITKDNKQHWETRDGDLVKGAYSLQEPDGKIRMVQYWADDTHGFNAIVKRSRMSAGTPPIKTPFDPPFKPLMHQHYGFGAAVTTQPTNVVPSIPPPQLPVSPSPPPPSSPSSSPSPPPPPNPAILGLVPLPGIWPSIPPQFQPPDSTQMGPVSIPWDPRTGSYGGWVPRNPVPKVPIAVVYSKKYVNGKPLHRATGPISLVGKTLVFKHKY